MRPAVLALVVVQVGVPLVLLGARWVDQGSRPRTELGASWQMYSSAPEPRYTGVDAAGRTWPLHAGELPPVVREVATGGTVPELFCTRHPRLVAVVRETGPEPGRYAC